MEKNVEITLRFVKNTGLPVFPVKTDVGAKSPFIKAPYDNASDDEEQIKAWGEKFRGCAFATHPGRGGYAVIDLDNHGGKDGSMALLDWELETGNVVPATLRVQTPSGGWHLWFKDDALTGGKDGFLKGVDVHGGPGAEGRYVLIPGQTMKAGVYKVVDKRPLAQLPEGIAAAVNEARGPQKSLAAAPSAPANTAPASSLDFSAVLEEIAAMKPLEEGGRDNALIALCLHWKEMGFTPSVYIALMKTMVEMGKIEKPEDFTESDFNRIAQSAWKKQSAVFGANSMEAMLPAVPQGSFERLSSIMKRDLPPPEWLIEGLMPAGSFGVLGGNAKSGKTYLCLQMVKALAAGEDFMGFKVPNKRKVLYLYLEGNELQVKKRCQELFPGEELPADVLFTFKYRALDLAGLSQLRKAIEQEKADLAIIDTWQRVRIDEGGRGANAYLKEYAEINRVKDEICIPTKCSVMVVHHLKQLSAKDAGVDDLSKLNGSSAIPGASDFIYLLNRERGADTAFLAAHGRDIEDIGIPLVKGDVMCWRRSAQEAGSLTLTPETEAQQRIVDVLGDAPEEGLTAREVAELDPELNYNTVSVQLNRWAKVDLVEKHGKKFRLYRGSEVQSK